MKITSFFELNKFWWDKLECYTRTSEPRSQGPPGMQCAQVQINSWVSNGCRYWSRGWLSERTSLAEVVEDGEHLSIYPSSTNGTWTRKQGFNRLEKMPYERGSRKGHSDCWRRFHDLNSGAICTTRCRVRRSRLCTTRVRVGDFILFKELKHRIASERSSTWMARRFRPHGLIEIGVGMLTKIGFICPELDQ